ncbi:PhoH family protein [Emcibacter sp. SYSU 3D8]|uniref:PhoH family protein n=1 Tax=Emcibacter sp. SYSU 3D8 TaxID=3133969 RepID=UPI0031FE8077
MPGGAAPTADKVVTDFSDNSLLPELFGKHDSNLALIEKRLGVTVSSRGNKVSIAGPSVSAGAARSVLHSLYSRLERGQTVESGDVEGAIRLAESAQPGDAQQTVIRTRKRLITPRSARQTEYVERIRESEIVFGVGPAGTGKTYLSVAVAVEMLLQGRVDRLILSRPAVEAGERIGFLPGDLRDKVDPYLRPLYDALHDMLPGDQVAKALESGDIEVAPLAFMRGRTLANSFIILDEAQNTTPMQMKMFLTRIGENSRMVIAGDPSQIDLPLGSKSGLRDALDILSGVPEVGVVHFGEADVVRHHLVTRIVQAYNENDRQRQVAQMARRTAQNGDDGG